MKEEMRKQLFTFFYFLHLHKVKSFLFSAPAPLAPVNTNTLFFLLASRLNLMKTKAILSPAYLTNKRKGKSKSKSYFLKEGKWSSKPVTHSSRETLLLLKFGSAEVLLVWFDRLMPPT